MKAAFVFLLLVGLAFCLPLDDYVALPDESYGWELANTVENEDFTLFVLKLTSQTWSFVETDKPVWQHWVRIIVPKNVGKGNSAMLYVTGGSNPLGNPPSSVEDFLIPVAINLGDIVVELNQVPNQPLTFAGETSGRTEDSLLAKTWDLFIETRDPYVIGRLPMVKSAVRAMDAIQEFINTLPEVPTPETFLVAGGSKRGWVTWLTAAVDKRVIAIAPLVIDILDMQPNINEIYQTYGRFPLALSPYTEQNITRCLNCPVFQELAAVEDPLVYIDRLKERNVPIFAINAAGDEFFIPSGWKWWFPKYSGEKFIRYMPNAEHSLATALNRVVNTLSAFMFTVDNKIKRPQVSFDLNQDKTEMTIRTDSTPVSVKLWQATNRRSRKFIVNCYLTCLWRSEELPLAANGTYVVRVNPPSRGYTAFMVELEFDVGFQENLILGTGASIVPDVWDEPSCPASECALCDTC